MGVFEIAGNVASGIQGARLGNKQSEMGTQMMQEAAKMNRNNPRPEMMTPQAMQMMMQLSQGRMFQQMPGMTNMQNQVNQATASGVGAMERSGRGSEAFGGIADIYANQMNLQSNLNTQNMQWQDQAAQQHMGNLNMLGQQQNQNWTWNQADPYLQAQQKAAMLEQQGRSSEWEGMKTKMGSWAESFQGIGSGLDDIANSAIAASTGGLSGLFGGGGGGGVIPGSALAKTGAGPGGAGMSM